MSHGEYAKCPSCGKIAFNKSEIESVFGYRYDGTKPQSWCKECRSNEKRNTVNKFTDVFNKISNLYNNSDDKD